MNWRIPLSLRGAASLLIFMAAAARAEDPGNAATLCVDADQHVEQQAAILPAAELGKTASARSRSMGPLRRSSKNPRYFENPNGDVVFIGGSHTWNNLVDFGFVWPPVKFDFDRYLDYLEANGHNTLRLWTWEVPWRDDAIKDPGMRAAGPLPWLRTGPGVDVGGQPKFDLCRFDPEYFRRLRQRVMLARQRGMYVIVMLFEGHVLQVVPSKMAHPFYPPNNVNHVEGLADGNDIYSLKSGVLLEFQKRYLRKVLDTLIDLDNVLFEVANEAPPASVEWQRYLADFVAQYEAARGVHHPVGLTIPTGGTNKDLLESGVDWISPGVDDAHFSAAPPVNPGAKVWIADTDHLGGATFHDSRWVWRSFLRGSNLLYMDNYVGAESFGLKTTKEYVEMKIAVGQANVLAKAVDLSRLTPSTEVSSTGFAMQDADLILAYVPDDSPVSLDMRERSGAYVAQWIGLVSGRSYRGGEVSSGKFISLVSPEPDGALLLLGRSTSAADADLIAGNFREVRARALRYAPFGIRSWELIRPTLRSVANSKVLVLLSLLASCAISLVLGIIFGRFMFRRRRSGS